MRFRPLVCSVALVASPAIAQEPERRADEIVVTAQQARKQVVSDGDLGALGAVSALETPFNVSGYTAQLILDQQAETIGDVLKNDPAVRTTQGFGNQAELFVIRGFTLNGDDVAMDGLFGITPRQIVSPELYERVQVLNGASAFLFGAAPGGSGVGGAINLIPKRAERTLLRATASYGQDSLFGGSVDAGTRFGADDTFGIRVNGVRRKGGTAIDGEEREVNVLGASLDARSGPGRVFLDFGYEDQRVDSPRPQVRLLNSGLAIPRVPGARDNYAQPWSFTKLRDIYAIARVELDVAPGWTAFAAAGFRDGREDGDYATVTIVNSATGAAQQGRLFVPREDNNESGQAGLRGTFTAGGISNKVSLGGAVNFQENRNAFAFGAFPAAQRVGCGLAATTTTSSCTSLYAPVPVPRPANGSTGGSLTDVPVVSKNSFGSYYASDTIGFADDRVLLTLGARRQSLRVENYNRASGVRTTLYRKKAWTPVIGLLVRPTPTLSIYANRIEALVQGPTAPATAANVAPGTIFAPFRSRQYEVGTKLAVRGLTATFAAFQTKQPSAISVTNPANTATVIYTVDGEQRNRGLELSLNGEPTRWLRIIGGGTILDAELRRTAIPANNGNRAIGVPKYQVNLGVELVPLVLRNATLTGRVVRTGSQYLDATNRQRLDGWTRFDLGMRYVAVADGHPLTFRVSAENVDNRRYWSSAFGGYLVQGGPRTIKASATFEY